MTYTDPAFRNDDAPLTPAPGTATPAAETPVAPPVDGAPAEAPVPEADGATDTEAGVETDEEVDLLEQIAAQYADGADVDPMDALATDEGAREVDAPDPATLATPAPHLADIPDDAPSSTAVWSSDDVAAALRGDAPVTGAAAGGQAASHPSAQQPDAQEADAGPQAAQPAPSAPGFSSSEPAAAAPAAEPAGQPGEADGPAIDHIEATAFAHEGTSPAQTLPFAVVEAAAPAPRETERMSGAAKGTGSLAWGSRSDVGCVRDHNEDSYLVQFPLFAIADGMGGHEAGEVASTLAVSSLANAGVDEPDAVALGRAIEAANAAVIQAAENGLGRPGMGTTCTAVVIDGDQMAVGHVGDSRCYLLHAGQLVRVTHDHSYVEELVAAGKITPEEARIHPNRSVITRALGSDPSMYADAFTIDLARGDRVMLCSDGLNSMITDDLIEEAMVTTPTPQTCADALVELALDAGGYDNVTCVVIDVKDDGTQANALRARLRNLLVAVLVALVVLGAVAGAMYGYSQNSWYLDDADGFVTLHRGIPGTWGPLPFNELVETSDVSTSKLSDAVETRLRAGIQFDSEDEARAVIESYRTQIADADAAKAEAAEKIDDARKAAGSVAAPLLDALDAAQADAGEDAPADDQDEPGASADRPDQAAGAQDADGAASEEGAA